MATTIDGVKTLQIRNAKNGDFDLNLAGGSGGESKPLFPTVKIEVGDSIVATIVEQGQSIDNVNVEIHAGGRIFRAIFGTICLDYSDEEVPRYFLDIGNNVVFELSVDANNQEILSISQISTEFSVIAYQPLSCEPNKVYYTVHSVEYTIDGVTERGRFVKLPLGIAEVVGIQNVYIDSNPSGSDAYRCLLAWLGSSNKNFAQYEKIGVIRTMW